RPCCIHLDVVAGAGRDVLDLQRSHNSPAVLVVGMTEVDSTSLAGANVAQNRVGNVRVREVAGVVVVNRARNLEQTPSLVDPDVADEVRNTGAAIGRTDIGNVRSCGSTKSDRAARYTADRIDDLGTVEVVRAAVIDADRRGHAVTELPSALDVVDTDGRFKAADQERRVVARTAMPRRGECRGGFTEGEAGELD